MKSTTFFRISRALAVLVTSLALGGIFAPPSLRAQAEEDEETPFEKEVPPANQSLYKMKNSYPAGTVAPYNDGGGVPAQALLTLTNITAANCTLAWYGMMGWYGVQGSPDGSTWTTLTNVPASDFAWQATVPNPFTNTAFFRLSQSNSFAGSGDCSGCHGDKYGEYVKTKHSVAFSSTSASANFPLVSRTVGFGQPTGFVDVTNTPFLKNVGCENCHGPAGWHKNSDHDLIRPAVSLDPSICGSCHQGSVHPTYEEYATSGHALPSRSTSAGCQVCHSADNRMVLLNEYNDMLAGHSHPVTLYAGLDQTNWTATCATCHDPHDASLAGQLRNPTFSTSFFTMPTVFDTRRVVTTNGTVVTTNTVNFNTVFDSLYNPKIQVCGQCHNTRGARWDGNAYGLVTTMVPTGPATNTVYVDILCTNTVTQVFTNELGVPYLTNTYAYTYVCGRAATTNVVMSQTNPVVGVGVTTSYFFYTNGTTVSSNINSSGYSRVPHQTSQYNILIGMVDYDYTNFVPVRTHAHTSAAKQCTSCHVPNYAVSSTTNVTGHTFNLDNKGCALAGCHTSYTEEALETKIKNIQFIETNNMVRVASMLNQWGLTKAPDLLRTNYAQMSWEFTSPGGLAAPDATHKVGPPSTIKNNTNGVVPLGTTNDNLQLQIPQDIRVARFDLYMVFNDHSVSVHNPTYVQALLDDAATRVSRQFTAANFATITATNVAGFAPYTVLFTNLGTGITGYSWNFGDGVGNSTSANPTYIYNNPGTYAVTFTATTATGPETLTKTNYIRILTAPALSFVADQTNVLVGTTVNFTSTSSNTQDVFRWTWYPRNGVSGAASYDTAGSSPSFSYTYPSPGTFSVQLRATCPGGVSGSYNRVQVTNVAYITVHN